MTEIRDFTGLRQWPVLEQVCARVAAMDEFLGAILIGSFAAGTADALSDIDLFLVVKEGLFEAAWSRRRELGQPDDLFALDVRGLEASSMGAHKFFTSGLVFVECLLTTPSGGARLAEPFKVIAGPETLPDLLPRRRPIDRSEMVSSPDDPGTDVDEAYARLIRLLRQHARPDSHLKHVQSRQ